MRIIPEVSAVQSTSFPISPGVTGTSLSIQHLETTINAEDGETVLLGGLITKANDKNENKAPWLGDLPGIGSLFRYRFEVSKKTELIVIMTPHIIRNRAEGDRILAEEAQRIDWNLKEVMRIYGNRRMAPFMPPMDAPCTVQPYRIVPGQPDAFQGPQPQRLPNLPMSLNVPANKLSARPQQQPNFATQAVMPANAPTVSVGTLDTAPPIPMVGAGAAQKLPMGPTQVEVPARNLPVAPVQTQPAPQRPSVSRSDVPNGPLLLPSATNYYSDNKK
jgi:hypothetical protein